MDLITAALAAGAAAGLTGAATQAVKDAYDALKASLGARFPAINLTPLEEAPGSAAKQGFLSRQLEDVGAVGDPDLLRLSHSVVAAIEREAPTAATAAGVDLMSVRAAYLNVQRVIGPVRVQDAEMAGGGINITDVGQIGGPDPNR